LSRKSYSTYGSIWFRVECFGIRAIRPHILIPVLLQGKEGISSAATPHLVKVAKAQHEIAQARIVELKSLVVLLEAKHAAASTVVTGKPNALVRTSQGERPLLSLGTVHLHVPTLLYKI